MTELIIDSLVHIVGGRLVTCRWGASITPHQTIHQLSATLLLINVTIWLSAFHAIQSLLNQDKLSSHTVLQHTFFLVLGPFLIKQLVPFTLYSYLVFVFGFCTYVESTYLILFAASLLKD